METLTLLPFSESPLWPSLIVVAPAVVIAAGLLCAGVILLTLPALRRHALAHPNARSSHRMPTPQGGGLGVVLATVFASSCALLVLGGGTSGPWIVFAATLLIMAVGGADDIFVVPVIPRLALQALAVGMVLAGLPEGLRVIPQLPWWLERGLLMIACLWFVNLVNFMDGVDWMTVAEVIPVAAGLVFISALGGLPGYAIVAAAALAGAMIGFAPFNRPAAKLFLGDVGSLPIGLLLAWLLVLTAGFGHLTAALLLPLYYLADATITLLRRLLRGDKVWQAHRMHFYQQAADAGLPARELAARVFGTNLVLAALATATVILPLWPLQIAALVLGIAAVTLLLVSFRRARR